MLATLVSMVCIDLPSSLLSLIIPAIHRALACINAQGQGKLISPLSISRWHKGTDSETPCSK